MLCFLILSTTSMKITNASPSTTSSYQSAQVPLKPVCISRIYSDQGQIGILTEQLQRMYARAPKKTRDTQRQMDDKIA